MLETTRGKMRFLPGWHWPGCLEVDRHNSLECWTEDLRFQYLLYTSFYHGTSHGHAQYTKESLKYIFGTIWIQMENHNSESSVGFPQITGCVELFKHGLTLHAASHPSPSTEVRLRNMTRIHPPNC